MRTSRKPISIGVKLVLILSAHAKLADAGRPDGVEKHWPVQRVAYRRSEPQLENERETRKSKKAAVPWLPTSSPTFPVELAQSSSGSSLHRPESSTRTCVCPFFRTDRPNGPQ